MTISELFAKLIDESPMTKTALGAELGIKPAGFGSKIRRDNVSTSFAAALLEKLGYQLVVVPRGSRLPAGSHVVTPGEGWEM